MNLEALVLRAQLMAQTQPDAGKCRVPKDILELEELCALAWKCIEGGDLPASAHEGCGTRNCVMHLVIEDQEDLDIQEFERHNKPAPRSIADMFRIGRAAGFFRGLGGYRD